MARMFHTTMRELRRAIEASAHLPDDADVRFELETVKGATYLAFTSTLHDPEFLSLCFERTRARVPSRS